MLGTFEISIPEKYVISSPDLNGVETNTDFNIMLDKYCSNIIKRGWKVWNGDDRIHSQVKSLTVEEFLLLAAYEGEVLYYSPYIQIEEDNIDDEIPEGLSNRTEQIELSDGVFGERIHTWRTWRDKSHPLTKIREYYYTVSFTFGNSLTTEELVLIHSTDGVKLIDNIPENANNLT